VAIVFVTTFTSLARRYLYVLCGGHESQILLSLAKVKTQTATAVPMKVSTSPGLIRNHAGPHRSLSYTHPSGRCRQKRARDG
jgi:hypothetical protein